MALWETQPLSVFMFRPVILPHGQVERITGQIGAQVPIKAPESCRGEGLIARLFEQIVPLT